MLSPHKKELSAAYDHIAAIVYLGSELVIVELEAGNVHIFDLHLLSHYLHSAASLKIIDFVHVRPEVRQKANASNSIR